MDQQQQQQQQGENDISRETTAAEQLPQEESWEHADFAADFTPHTTRRVPLYYPYLSLLGGQPKSAENINDGNKNNNNTNNCNNSNNTSWIDIQSIDTSKMTLLDVCNYTPEPNVDGSGHCIWMGAIYLIHALSLGMAMADHDDDDEMTRSRSLALSQEEEAETLALSSRPSNGWYNDSYFPSKVVAELGCGTGTAGIALLTLLSMKPTTTASAIATDTSTTRQTTTPNTFIFWDNDPEALELCRKNCQHNLHLLPKSQAGVPVVCEHQLDPGWVLDSEIIDATTNDDSNSNQHHSATATNHNHSIDTILATDVLYDLKIIRPFLETVARMLSNSNAAPTIMDGDHDDTKPTAPKAATKHLILSHVPRWFLPRNNEGVTSISTSSNHNEPARALEDHILREASRCGLSLMHTVRPKDVLDQHRFLLGLDNGGDRYGELDGQSLDVEARENLLNDLDDMGQAGAVLWVFVLDT